MRFLMTAVLLCIACLAFAGCATDDKDEFEEWLDASVAETRYGGGFDRATGKPVSNILVEDRDIVGHTTDMRHSQATRWAHPYWVESTETTLTIHGNWCKNGWKNYWEIPSLEWATHWIGVRNDEVSKPEAKWNLDEVMQHYEGNGVYRRIHIHCTRRK